jgi:acetyl-CoA C-acetyltransferase
MRDVVIASGARTPIGSFQGALSSLTAPELGAIAIRAALERARLAPTDVDECYMGCVLTAGIGQAPARQAAKRAGLPDATACLTVGKVCGSGLEAVVLAAQAVRQGDAEVIVAGGMESMSNAPYLLPQARGGYRLGHGQLLDSMIKDGLWDVYNDFHMGDAAELCARELQITREQQDAFAVESYRRALAAQAEGRFKDEIAPVEIPAKKKGAPPSVVTDDEEPRRGDPAKLPTLKPAFQKDGTITAANASKINDGAAALVVTTLERAKKLGLEPLARVVSHGHHAQAPEWFTTAPVYAIEKALGKAQLAVKDVDLFEVNEAFAVVSLACAQKGSLPAEKTNVNGGAVALGHPIGASGARILVTLLYAMRARAARRGLASLCIGGGEGIALVVERL